MSAPVRCAAVRSAHRRIFAVDALLLSLKVRGFAGLQLSALDALRDAVLLILPALADFVVAVVRRAGVVLVVVDPVRQVVLLTD